MWKFTCILCSYFIYTHMIDRDSEQFLGCTAKLLSSTWLHYIYICRCICVAFSNWEIRSCIWHYHDDVIKWKQFPRYWPFVRGIHRSPVNSPHKGQWRGALIFSLICVWINGCVNNREAGDLRRYHAHYDVIVMIRGGVIHTRKRLQRDVHRYCVEHNCH